MIDFRTVNKIYLMPGYTDLRLGIDGYAAIVELKFNGNPTDGSLYIFCNRSRNKIKILHFEYSGYWLYYKRIETGHVKWPNMSDINSIEEKQFRWLFDGISINQKGFKKCIQNSTI